MSANYCDIISFLERNMLQCPYKQTFGIDCPGCGLQRSLLMLFQGNVCESLKLYPATIPLFGMFFSLILHLKYKFEYGAGMLKYFFIFNALVIFVNYITKHLL